MISFCCLDVIPSFTPKPNAFGYDMIWAEILSSTDIMGNLWG